MKELNRDIETRDKLIYRKYRPNFYTQGGGIRHFTDLDAKTLQELVDMNFADPEDKQNDSPTLGEILEFLKKYPAYTAHGYSVSAERPDYRVSIEGVEKGIPSESVQEFQDYMALFRNADEFSNTTMYCWFD